MNTAPVTAGKSTTGERFLVAAAFFAIYVLWGTTFLGIRVAVEELPPLFAAGSRFFTAGVILFVVMRLKGEPNPTRIEWRNLAIISLLMFVVEYAALFWGEKYISSGISSVFSATIPVFTLIAEVVVLRQQRWNAVIAASTALGFAGVAVLMLPGGQAQVPLLPALAILVGSSTWALGGAMSKSMKLPPSRPMTSAGTMMLGGAGLFLFSALAGEMRPFPHITTRGFLAVVYLIVVGSLLAFTAFVWLLGRMPATQVASYAFFNPIVAVALGYFLLHEPVTARTAAGAALVLASVFLILRGGRRKPA